MLQGRGKVLGNEVYRERIGGVCKGIQEDIAGNKKASTWDALGKLFF